MHIELIRSFLVLRSECTSQAQVWNLILSAAVLGDGTFRRWLGLCPHERLIDYLRRKDFVLKSSICDELALTCCHAGKVFSWDMSRHRCQALGLPCLNISLSGQADFKLFSNPDCFHSRCPHALAAVALRKACTMPRKEFFSLYKLSSLWYSAITIENRHHRKIRFNKYILGV